MQKIAVTGGLSSGKSLVCRFFKNCGAYVVSADEIVHRLLASETAVIRKVVDLLGKDVLVRNRIDRAKVAKKVFKNTQLLKSLEHLLHPIVYDEIETQYQQSTAPLFVAEIPLLFETRGERFFDTTIAVDADPEVCWKRFHQRTGCSKEEYIQRMSQQLSSKEKAQRADIVILNNGTEANLQDAVKMTFDMLVGHPN